MLLFLLSLAFADPTPEIIYEDETIIDFEEVSVEASIQKPEGTLITEMPRSPFNPLIRVRDNFNEEMFKSLDAVKSAH